MNSIMFFKFHEILCDSNTIHCLHLNQKDSIGILLMLWTSYWFHETLMDFITILLIQLNNIMDSMQIVCTPLKAYSFHTNLIDSMKSYRFHSNHMDSNKVLQVSWTSADYITIIMIRLTSYGLYVNLNDSI